MGFASIGDATALSHFRNAATDAAISCGAKRQGRPEGGAHGIDIVVLFFGCGGRI